MKFYIIQKGTYSKPHSPTSCKGVSLLSLYTRLLFGKRDGFGMNELLGIAAALILAAFIIIPQLRIFATNVMSGLSTWWDTIDIKVFTPS